MTLVDIDHQPQPEFPAAVEEATKVSVAEVSFTSLEGTPSISGVVAGIEDVSDAGEDSVTDDTVLADGAVLTENEVEEVLKDAFAETDQTVLTQSAREGAAPVGDHLAWPTSILTPPNRYPAPPPSSRKKSPVHQHHQPQARQSHLPAFQQERDYSPTTLRLR